MHEALVAHPGIRAITPVNSTTTEAILRLTENLLGTCSLTRLTSDEGP
jgi:hypothetical protein